MSQQRNTPCACGSGLKFKRCCMLKGFTQTPTGQRSTMSDAQVERIMRREMLPICLVALALTSVR